MSAPTLTEALAARGLTHRKPTPADFAAVGRRWCHGRAVLRADEVLTIGTASEVWAWLREAKP